MVTRTLAAAGVAITVALASGGVSAQQQHDHDQWGTVGQQVMLTACVEKGMKDDTFVLTRVADVPVHPPTMGRVVYWLDSVKDVKKHVGHQIRVNGKISDVEQSEMEVKSGEDEGDGWYVEMEGPGRDVRTPAANVGVTVAGRENQADDIKTTLVKLKVSDVTKVADGCPAR